MFFENEADRLLKRFLTDPFFGMGGGSCGGGSCRTERNEENADLLRGPGVRYYGFVVTTGPDGRPVVREYGDSVTMGREAALGAAESGSPRTREPLVDTIVDEKAKVVKMIAEMPGVEKRDIKIAVEGKHVSVSAKGGGGKKYRMRIPLERRVDANSAKATYRNGILQITFGLAEDANRGKTVRVD